MCKKIGKYGGLIGETVHPVILKQARNNPSTASGAISIFHEEKLIRFLLQIFFFLMQYDRSFIGGRKITLYFCASQYIAKFANCSTLMCIPEIASRRPLFIRNRRYGSYKNRSYFIPYKCVLLLFDFTTRKAKNYSGYTPREAYI